MMNAFAGVLATIGYTIGTVVRPLRSKSTRFTKREVSLA